MNKSLRIVSGRTALGSNISQQYLRGGAATLPPPPFARLPTPTQKIPENAELVWNDGVAPELCIDFDAQHITRQDGLKRWLMGIAFFPIFMGVVALSDPEGLRVAVRHIDDSPLLGYYLSLLSSKSFLFVLG